MVAEKVRGSWNNVECGRPLLASFHAGQVLGKRDVLGFHAGTSLRLKILMRQPWDHCVRACSVFLSAVVVQQPLCGRMFSRFRLPKSWYRDRQPSDFVPQREFAEEVV